jgi:hypothetical protein
VDVVLYRRLRDKEGSRDLGVPATLSDERCDFPFARGKTREEGRGARMSDRDGRIASVDAQLIAIAGAGERHDRLARHALPRLPGKRTHGVAERRKRSIVDGEAH